MHSFNISVIPLERDHMKLCNYLRKPGSGRTPPDRGSFTVI